jgi:dTDP-4-dehydrorhamnose reductase
MMTILILGGGGMLGHRVWLAAHRRFTTAVTLRGTPPAPLLDLISGTHILDRVDAADFQTVERAVDAVRPDAIVNCIGIVKQLEAGADPIPSIEINALLPHRLARLAAARGVRLIHISTDCVFSGRTGGYTEDDVSDADDLYGRSKRLGEVTGPGALTIRTSMIGRELHGAHGLVEWFLSQRGGRVRGFTRAFFSGLTTPALADLVVQILAEHPDLSGLYHVAADRISKFDLLALVNDAYAAGVTIEPDDAVVIDRSLNGARFARATGWAPEPWRAMVTRLAADAIPYDTWRQGC